MDILENLSPKKKSQQILIQKRKSSQNKNKKL